MNEPRTPNPGDGDDRPGTSAAETAEWLSGPLSPARRLRAVTALLAGLGGGIFVTLLWATEPGTLPGRTRWAFGVLLALCAAWTAYGGWTLARRPLYAAEGVVAGWLAVVAAVLTTGGTAAVAGARGTGLPAALAAGAVLTAAAVLLVVRAHGRRAALRRRARELS